MYSGSISSGMLGISACSLYVFGAAMKGASCLENVALSEHCMTVLLLVQLHLLRTVSVPAGP